MWLFVDETWAPDDHRPRFGILFGVLVRHDQLARLDHFLFSVRRKYLGVDNAKDPEAELKGKDLLSNYAVGLWTKNKTMPHNLCVVKEMLTYPVREEDFYLRAFASCVYGQGDRRPSLLAPEARQLATPFRRLIENASQAAREDARDHSVTLVFDQRLGAQKGIAVAVQRFVAGMQLPNVHPYPYFAVSTASPGVQVADVFAHLLSKKIQRKTGLTTLYNDLNALQWQSGKVPGRRGFMRYDEIGDAQGTRYLVRDRW